MGRITIFIGDDVNSKQAMLALERRGLPYKTVSLVSHPAKLQDMVALCDGPSVPQVFFNTRYIGGLKKTVKELRRWDRSSRYQSPLEKYNAEVGPGLDPANPRLSLPSGEGVLIKDSAAALTKLPANIRLPDGTKTTIVDITDKLKLALPRMDQKLKGKTYRDSFTGKQAVMGVSKALGVGEGEATIFLSDLIANSVVKHVTQGFKGDLKPAEVYQLQCFAEPAVLNSFCAWTEPAEKKILDIVEDLLVILDQIERESLDASGLLDYMLAQKHPLYSRFEAETCMLQVLSKTAMTQLDETSITVFGLNMYMLMIRYASLKVGIPLSESDRLHFVQSVKFNVGGNVFSFQDWTDQVLRGETVKTLKLAAKLDYRVHFAINAGSCGGSTCSLPFNKFSVKFLQDELDVAAKSFCGDGHSVVVKRKKSSVELATIFKLYLKDMGKIEKEMLEKVALWLPGKAKSDLLACLSSGNAIDIGYRDPQLGFHTAAGPWYERHLVETEVKGLKAMLKRFKAPKMDKKEHIRLATLRALHILDTYAEDRFDRITEMVRETFDMKLVFVSLVDQNRQWFKSNQWCITTADKADETGRDISFCGHAILLPDDLFIVENAAEHPDFADNPLVTGPVGIRFYAGCPLRVPSATGAGSSAIGTLCMIDQKPRTLDEDQKQQFKDYAAMIKREILRRNSDSSTSLGSTSSIGSDVEDDL